MNYEVTIGIPAYKAVDYIEKTMESALNQTFDSIEYLIVDDCGNDGTIHIVERFQKEHPRGKDVHIIYNKQNLGIGKTRNIILEQAQGKYLYFLDSDDLIEPNTITLLLDFMKKYQCDVVYASYEKIDTLQSNSKQVYQYPSLFFDSNGQFAKYVFDQYGMLVFGKTWLLPMMWLLMRKKHFFCQILPIIICVILIPFQIIMIEMYFLDRKS